MITNAGEDVRDLALCARRVTDAIGGQQRELQTPRNSNQGMIACFFITIEVTLQFNIDIVSAENVHEFLCDPVCALRVSVVNSILQWPIFSSSQAHQSI